MITEELSQLSWMRGGLEGSLQQKEERKDVDVIREELKGED